LNGSQAGDKNQS
jgi:hypothetical protein